jgi:hypothetical protein
MHLRLSVALIPLALLLAACASPPAAVTSPARCADASTDSARAVCRALDTLARGFQLPSRVLTIERTNDSYSIRTVPADPNRLDGMALVIVGRGDSILGVEVSDSL